MAGAGQSTTGEDPQIESEQATFVPSADGVRIVLELLLRPMVPGE